jgi:putative ABC transport system permease protein
MLWRDLSFAWRTLRRSPVFTIAAVATIALGIGASTAMFTVVRAVLLRPLPYSDPDRLVVMYMDLRNRNNLGMPLSNENFIDIRDGSKGSVEDMAAFRTVRQVLPGADGTPEQIRLATVTTNFFRLLGHRVVLGRDFQEADGIPQPLSALAEQGAANPPPPTFAILSHEYWQRRYGGDRHVIGQRLPVGPRPEIVGVLAPELELLMPPATNVERRPDIWIANRLSYDNANRNTFGLRPIGRLREKATLEQAQQEVEAVAAKIRAEHPISRGSGFYARLEPMHKTLVDEVRPAILALMGAVIFLWLIACANVANLLLVRTSLREPEMAMRAALGAARWRVIWQLLIEAVLLTGIGMLGGVALAWIGIRQVLALAPANLPRVDTVAIDPMVLMFTAFIALAAAVVFGFVPAVSAFRMDLVPALSGGAGRSAGLGRRGRLFRSVIVVLEVALCFVLLVGSGLMFRSFLEIRRVDPGFDPNGLMTFQLLGGRPGPAEQRTERQRQLEDRLRAIPGVIGVTASNPLPLAGNFTTIRWGLEDALTDNTKYQAVDWQIVRPGYFDTMRTPVVTGRTFVEADNDANRNLAVVDTMLASKAFPNEQAVGKRILVRIRTAEPEWVEIIGVVGHQRVTSLSDPGREQVYFAERFLGGGGATRWAVRTAGDPAHISNAVRAAVTAVDPLWLINEMQPMSALVGRAQSSTRFSLVLIGVLGIMAVVLVSVGLYGVLSTIVRQRTAEIGVRMALGASPGRILRLILLYGLRLSVAGIGIGLASAFVLTRAMRSMLVGVGPTDPMTYVIMGLVFLAIAALSLYLPARRAAALTPTAALRQG